MNADDLVAALDLPAAARVDQRVPKKLLVEHGAPTPADKRRLQEGLEEVWWLAALKPTTIGVSVFRDAVREYLEIAVLRAVLRPRAKPDRLTELLHRSVPYPVLLVAAQDDTLTLSLVHKRWSLGESGVTVLDGALVAAEVAAEGDEEVTSALIQALPVGRQPRAHLHSLYQGWMDTVAAALVARRTGTFAMAESPQRAEERRAGIDTCVQLEAQMARLRSSAAKEKQMARRVELNLELKRVEAAYAAARAQL